MKKNPALRDRPFNGNKVSDEWKSRAEGAARDLEGGELIKTVLDAGIFQPLQAEYTMQMCPNRVISVNELQHFFGKTAYNRKILAKIE